MVNLISSSCLTEIVRSDLEDKIKILFGVFEDFNKVQSSELTYKEMLWKFVDVQEESLKKASDDEGINNFLIHLQGKVHDFLNRDGDL